MSHNYEGPYGGGPPRGPHEGPPHGPPPSDSRGFSFGGPPGGHHPPPHLESHQTHESSNVSTVKGTLVKVFSEVDKDFNLAIENGKAVVAKANDSDPHQQWIKDESWSNKAKDAAGFSAFALVNKATGRALTRPREAEAQVLWTIGKDEGHGYHALRPVGDVKLNLDIDHGSKKYGSIHEGQAVILFTWKNEENQKWQLKATGGEHEGHHHHFHL